jgi:hypothetical protein
MLTATRLSIKPYFYPLGNTPATHLLRNHLPSVEPVEILAIGCGDVRNILFTIWSEQRRACKFNFTACDYDAAVLGKHTCSLHRSKEHIASRLRLCPRECPVANFLHSS